MADHDTSPAPDAGEIPTAVVDALTSTWRSTIELLTGLPADDWDRSTDLPGWTVRDVVSHLIGTERMMHGLPGAPTREIDAPWVKNPIGDLNENEVELRRSRPGAEVLAEFASLAAEREAALRGADAAFFAQPTQTPVGPGTMADFLSIRTLDCWVHEQDLRRVLGRPGSWSNEAAELTVDRLLRTVPMVVGKRAACPEGGAVRLVIVPGPDGGVSRDVTCRVTGGRAGFVDASPAPPSATITMGTDTFVWLANGRPGGPDDHVVIDGDAGLGARVVANLTMMI